MDKEKLIKQLFIGKVTEILGFEKTSELLKETIDALNMVCKDVKPNEKQTNNLFDIYQKIDIMMSEQSTIRKFVEYDERLQYCISEVIGGK